MVINTNLAGNIPITAILKDRLFLMGFMGCGKSTQGKKLAKTLKLPFADLDQVIEEKLNRSIRDFMDENGEKAFRAIERECLTELAENFSGVIALGGGAPCNDKNLKTILKSGTAIYLRYPVSTLCQRLERGKAKRPLIAHLHGDALADFVAKKLEERSPYYEQAHVIYDFKSDPDKDALAFILRALRG